MEKVINSYQDLEVWKKAMGFLRIARGALLEVETLMTISHNP